MKLNIDHRRPMQARTADAIIEAATALRAIARPVFTATGAIDEVHLYRDGQLRASIFKPTYGRLGIWRAESGAAPATANTPAEAVRRALDPLRKHTRKLPKTAEIGHLSSCYTASRTAGVSDIGVSQGALNAHVRRASVTRPLRETGVACHGSRGGAAGRCQPDTPHSDKRTARP
jgi:hypothetical protein